MSWVVERFNGTAAEFHHREAPTNPAPSVWWFDVAAPAIALGSSQSEELVDHQACEAEGVEVVRRRSGGGAVLLVPGQTVWFDLVVPRGHRRWDDDIARAAWWVGDVVREVLDRPDLSVHRGSMVTTPWSGLVCFAGLGPGEIVSDGRKVLGVSQRRTRDAARFQCALYRVWEPDRLIRLLREPRPEPGSLDDIVTTADIDLDDLVAALG